MKNILNRTQKTLKERTDLVIFIIKFVVIPLIIILLAIRIFVVKTYERELFFSDEANVQRDEVEVGSEGYGNISAINVNVGDFVNKGDILYRYNNSDLDNKIFNLQKLGNDLLLDETSDGNIAINDFNKNIEFVVRAKVDGIIKEININIGDYVTKEEVTMVMENSTAYVTSYIKVPVNYIGKIVPGVQAFIKVSNEITLGGFIKDVSPNYDADKNLLKVNVLISNKELSKVDIKNISSGTPVEVIVKTPDPFTQTVKDSIENINVNFIKKYLSYEI